MQKLYYSISEVSDLLHEEQHILRYWEKEFSSLKPRKNRAGNRVYSQKDIILLKLIKKLLRANKLSIDGAKIQFEHIINKYVIEEIENLLFQKPDSLFSLDEQFVHKDGDFPEPFDIANPEEKLTHKQTNELDLMKNDLVEVLGLLKEIREFIN